MQHILTGCYVAKPKGPSHISKHCGARMRNENGVWHVWQDVETFARSGHALILKRTQGEKKSTRKPLRQKQRLKSISTSCWKAESCVKN